MVHTTQVLVDMEFQVLVVKVVVEMDITKIQTKPKPAVLTKVVVVVAVVNPVTMEHLVALVL